MRPIVLSKQIYREVLKNLRTVLSRQCTARLKKPKWLTFIVKMTKLIFDWFTSKRNYLGCNFIVKYISNDQMKLQFFLVEWQHNKFLHMVAIIHCLFINCSWWIRSFTCYVCHNCFSSIAGPSPIPLPSEALTLVNITYVYKPTGFGRYINYNALSLTNLLPISRRCNFSL